MTPAVAPVTATTPGYPGNWPYRQAVSTSGPTWASGVPAAGSLAAHRWEQRLTRVRSWQSKRVPSEKSMQTVERKAIYVTPPVQGPKRERRTLHPVPRGGFHKAGEGPAFGGSLVTFCPPRKSPQRSVPGWGAGFCQGNWRSRLFHLCVKAEDTTKEKSPEEAFASSGLSS